MVVAKLLSKNVSILNAEKVVKEVQKKKNITLTTLQVRSIMRDDLGLAYRMSRKVPVQGNSERCLVLRQQYAMEMIPLLQDGKRILNIDESWLNETNFIRKMWCPPGTTATVSQRPISHRLALIAALDTEGCIYYSLTQSNTDQNVILVFLIHLIE